MADWWEELKAATGGVKKKAAKVRDRASMAIGDAVDSAKARSRQKRADKMERRMAEARSQPAPAPRNTSPTRDLSVVTAASRIKGRKAQIDRAIDEL